MKIFRILIFVYVFCYFLNFVSIAQSPGSLDFSFGDTGIANLSLISQEPIKKTIPLSDGKYLTLYYNSDSGLSGIFCFNENGTINEAFGSLGQVSLDFFNFTYFHYLIPHSNKFIVSGYGFSTFGIDYLFVARLLNSGEIDTSFGSNGNGLILFPINSNGFISDYNLIASNYSSELYFTVVESNFTDPITTSLTTAVIGDEILEYYELNESDNIELTANASAGFFHTVVDSENNLYVAYQQSVLTDMGTSDWYKIFKILPNGALDSTFGANGAISEPFDQNSSRVSDIAILNNNVYLLTGQTETNTNKRLTCFDQSGELVSSFGSNGSINLDFLIGANYSTTMIATFENTGIYIPSHNGGEIQLRLIDSNGTPVSTFGQNGIVSLNAPNPSSISSIHIQNDGKILISGMYNGDQFAARLHGVSVSLSVESSSSKKNKIKIVAQNPVGQTLIISTSDDVEELFLIDLSGRIVDVYENRNASGHFILDLNSVSKGVYFIFDPKSLSNLRIAIP